MESLIVAAQAALDRATVEVGIALTEFCNARQFWVGEFGFSAELERLEPSALRRLDAARAAQDAALERLERLEGQARRCFPQAVDYGSLGPFDDSGIEFVEVDG